MSDADPTERQQRKKPGCIGCWDVLAILGILAILAGTALGPIGGQRRGPENAAMQMARMLALAMFQYANDNDQKYPDGKSSTEVFQKLIDGGYISDPTIFYIALPGKTPAIPDQKKLKPENVSWDVTSGADSSSPDQLPLVFLTGFKVSYVPGGAAVPLVKPFPHFGWMDPNQSSLDWFVGRHTIRYFGDGGLAVAYKSNSAKFMRIDTSANPDDSIPNFVPPDFKPDGKTYRQLTPDGVLP